MPNRVLIVDDEESVCRLIEMSLRFDGIESVSARNGIEALKVLQRDKDIGLVLLDLMMPHMDGYAFRHAQRLDPALAGIPVVVVTGLPAAQILRDQLDAAGYLAKPFQREQLVEIVRRQLAA
jgi:CheY-like chemotaxis protein